jgi:hypothetical protein
MRKTIFSTLAAVAAAFVIASPASAKPAPPPPPPSCSVVTFSVATISCLGFFAGNLVTDSGPKLVEALGYTVQLDPNADSLIEKFDLSGGTIDFDTDLSGPTVIGLHFGGGSTGYNGTGFWLLDVPAGTDSFTWSSTVQQGISNAGLYSTGTPGVVPEPATWAMMIAGFGLTGAAMRRRKSRVAVTYA